MFPPATIWLSRLSHINQRDQPSQWWCIGLMTIWAGKRQQFE